MRINVLYFTSTGNTLWLAEKSKEIIEQQGHEVKLYEVINDGEAFLKDECDMVGIYYPVWDYLMPKPLHDFVVNKIPSEGKGKKIFLIGDCAGSIANTNLKYKKILDAKGYDTFYLDHFYMSCNFNIPWFPFMVFTKVLEGEGLKNNLQKCEEKLQKICSAVLNLETRLEGKGIYFQFLRWMQDRGLFMFSIWKKNYSVAKDRCINCGLCVKMCPTGNITKDNDGNISFGSNCIMCVKCYNLCPKNAVLIFEQSKNTEKYKRFKGFKGFKPDLYRK